MKEPIIMIDSEDAMRILQVCGSQSLAVFLSLQALGNPCSIEDVQKFTGMSLEETKEAAARLGVYQLGIVRKPMPVILQVPGKPDDNTECLQ
ncbi:hypothetical protein NZD89_27870 (plasmid) [Alicyclobacillus fastidiosus]|uniref:Uncharacterized protein n=1 Tax=Alicyclobacillus fastidiosus TaxID=392011 RepID=A0ABY6ZPU2_9BACL|nr:hypothetical protein [Alicyclobacillus fastidiosus]WAH44867.1 hypothetical protein NZD89_27870 [Alicyclobacillus fastidiosus]GMA65623.1 hypothetical protein GCM10025859_60630 [Alicyclobacillus fastidiosus]GMA65840.1 hypothetical protein GCM10025859_62800 [Alicyclobacillus fastidiosus]